VAQNVSRYQEASLNLIKNRQWGYTCHQIWVQNQQKNITGWY